MKTIVVDSFSVLYRSLYSPTVSEFDRSDGQPVEFLLEFLDKVLELSKEFRTNKFIFCFDSKYNKRKELYTGYKEGRHVNDSPEIQKRKERLRLQVPLLKRVLFKCGFRNLFEQNGYEADDMIAEIVYNNTNMDFITVTSDQDLLQTIRPNNSVKLFSKQYLITEDKFKDTYFGLEAQEFWKVKALGGCLSDKVSGIKGVGEKSAIKYLLGSLNKNTKVFKNIENDKNIFDINTKIVKLPLDGVTKNKLEEDTLSIDSIKSALEYLDILELLEDEDLDPWRKFISNTDRLEDLLFS